MSKIYRLHYRGQLKENVSMEKLQSAVNDCVKAIRNLQAEGKMLTAALYYADKMLFLYYEAVGEPLPVTEPAAIQPPLQRAWEYGGRRLQELPGRRLPVDGADSSAGSGANAGTISSAGSGAVTETGGNASAVVAETAQNTSGAVVEAGEDVLAAVPHPTEFLAPLAPFLMPWPGQKGERLWVHMYHIYYHSIPESIENWRRAAVPEKRRGRIAFLRDDKLFSYVYFHRAIVEEGLLTGDKYQSIALHENILFSYFEEPKTITNIRDSIRNNVQNKAQSNARNTEQNNVQYKVQSNARNDKQNNVQNNTQNNEQNSPEENTQNDMQNTVQDKSRVIEDWMAVNPESHFIHMPEGEGENFMFLPALFALGVEDAAE